MVPMSPNTNIFVQSNQMNVLSEDRKKQIILDFEISMQNVKHEYCKRCHRVSLCMKMVGEHCSDCTAHPNVDCVKENRLPIWIDDNGNIRHDIPDELTSLTEAEKLLIQMVSPYIPFVHIKNGTLGMDGHVCSFPQKIQQICTELPKLPTEVTVIKMVRNFMKSDGELGIKIFNVRRTEVLAALRWLVKYNAEYRAGVTINEDNLSWMGDEDEKELNSVISMLEEDADDEHDSLLPGLVDLGPAEQQCLPQLEVDELPDAFRTCGLHVEDSVPIISKTDANIGKTMTEAASGSSARLMWPFVSEEPINEYDEDERLFCKAFPWLFPGGVGDINDYRENKMHPGDWAENLLLYKDGRFARDKMWSFFTLNYVTRRRNQNSGRYFIDGFYKDSPQTIDELKERLRQGDNSFLDKITYYSHRVRASGAYWRHIRSQVYSWINYHVAAGHGAPNFFITLSCAEYFWADAIRLINDRLEKAGHPDAVSNDLWYIYIICIFFSNNMLPLYNTRVRCTKDPKTLSDYWMNIPLSYRNFSKFEWTISWRQLERRYSGLNFLL